MAVAPAETTRSERIAHADTVVSGQTQRLAGAERAHELVGTCVGGRYRLLSLVGVGGMGAVYRARDDELDEIVALKLLRDDLAASERAVELIRREVRLARRVTHRNVARIFEIGEHRGGRFITLEFIEGLSLAALLDDEGVLSPARAEALLRDVCRGLQAIHDAGVIHGDVKPANVLVADDGRVVITDFGIARAAASSGDELHKPPLDEAVAGTPAYMAPELLTGGEVTRRSDIYALGVIAFEMVTGDLPWKYIDPARGRLGAPPPDPREHAVLSDAFGEAIVRALAREPRDRPGDVHAFSHMFSGTGPRARRPGSASAASAVSAGSAAMGAHAGLEPCCPPPSPDEAKHAVAVLPVENRGSADDDYLAGGLTEDVIDRLSMLARLRVLSRGATMRLAGDPREPHELGRALGVDTVIQGSLERTPAGLHVRMRAIASADASQWWASRFDLAPEQLLTAGDEVARVMTARVTERAPPAHAHERDTARDTVHDAVDHGERAPGEPPPSGAARPPAVRTSDTEPAPRTRPSAMPDEGTLEAYLRARDAYRRMIEPGETLRLYERALERGAGEPLIEAGHAMALLRAWMLSTATDEALERAARAAVLRAGRAAPHLGETRLADGLYHLHLGDPVTAVREFRAAIALAPSMAEAHWLLGMMLSELGHVSEAWRRLDSAAGLDPSMKAPNVERRRMTALLGDWDAEHALAAQAPEATTALGHVMSVRLAAYRGDREQLARVADSVAALPEDSYGMKPRVTAMLAVYLGRAPASDAYPLLVPPPSPRGHSRRRLSLVQQLRAEVAGFAGDLDVVLDAIEHALDCGLVDLLWLECCPLLASARSDPRFDALRARLQDRAHAAYDAMFGRLSDAASSELALVAAGAAGADDAAVSSP